MSRGLGWVWKSLLVAACIAYQWAVHTAVIDRGTGPIRLALAYVPLFAIGYWALLHAKRRLLWLGALAVAAGMIFWMQHAVLGVAAAYGIPHAAINLLLLVVFARTLRSGRDPLITRLARRVHGTLTASHDRYTRRLTIAWCCYFTAQLVASGLLFAFAPLSLWSLYVNVLNFPLLALAFVGEHIYRVTCHPEIPHVSIRQAVQAFIKDSRYPDRVEAR